ncbi:hypothetical protein ACTFIR_009641 [Dictyostelium discoideum]
MANTENISYIICSSFTDGNNFCDIYQHFIITIKDDYFFYKSLSDNSNNQSKILVDSSRYIKICGKTFEISCFYFNSHNGISNTIDFYQIDYCEPDDNFSRYSCKESFCIANMDRTPNVCFYFKKLLVLEFLKNDE